MKYLTFLILFLALPLLAFAQATTGAVNTDTGFVPLTNIPQLTEIGGAFSLEAFLNALYRISIGIAAVVAVLQIMRAGIMYMGSDSGFAEKKEAKNLIALSIGGLILVLSPVVVFSIINPEILTLKIGNIEKLRSATSTPATPAVCSNENYNAFQPANVPTGGTCSDVLGDGWANVWAQERVCCEGLTAGQTCCARSSTYQPPPPNPEDSAASYSFVTRDTTPPACKLPTETRGFDNKEACKANLASVAANANTVITKNCDNQFLNPPTPEARWNEIKNLPVCQTR